MKSEVVEIFWKFKAFVTKSDNKVEYTSEKFKNFFQDASIEHQLTAPYTPQQNVVVERKKI
ncbi:Retrovirus-related Pol polyprotein from transposon TNT 1-94 [Gossypium australe]|uniref:Retrovirus-related Pol polyprotein from transposon TNT 1-94 n=1 Tax=Gossypium australe TaxID=47621 RepID=A0A5B6UN69_9ROSI|nr:Retrovirus-related Pol polyprotein from transposon TNT 1-94 [Gossypium australe]